MHLQLVAVKQLDRGGCQGIREFVVEVMTLSMANHPNLVNLIGYCAEGDQRLLVYEYMPLGSLEDHLHGMPLSFLFSPLPQHLNTSSSQALNRKERSWIGTQG